MNCPPILAYTDRVARPCAWWRITQPYTRLGEQGVDAQWCQIDERDSSGLDVAGRVVVLQRVAAAGDHEQVNDWVASLRQAGALAVVYELDDDIISPAFPEFVEACGEVGPLLRQKIDAERQAQVWTLQACDAVTVSTFQLAELVSQYTRAPIWVIPNAIDVEWYTHRLAPRPEWRQHLTVGWAGWRKPEQDLEPMAEAWGRIAQRYHHVRFVVAGWQPDCVYREVEDLDRIIRLPTAELDDWPQSMQVDIGCCPLADTPFNRCKSPIKSYEYALAGAAVVTSRTVYGRELYGLRADLAATWEVVLSELVENFELRNGVAHLGKRIVQQLNGLEDNLYRWSDAYVHIANSAGVPA